MQKISKADLANLKPQVVHRYQAFPSLYLDREVTIDVFLPPGYDSLDKPCHLMFFNDGQQSARMRMGQMLRCSPALRCPAR